MAYADPDRSPETDRPVGVDRARDGDPTVESMREEYQSAHDAWDEIRKEAQIDMRYVSGDPWDPDEKQRRKAQNRPALALDELGQYFNQTINDFRANPRSIQFAPVGLGANDKGARFYADKTREIEYRSKAQLAYITAFENAVQRSYGFLRIKTAYAGDETFDQDILIEPIPNPDLVTPDPYAMRPDGLDQEQCWVEEWWDWRKIRREFPDAKTRSWDAGVFESAPSWGNDRGARVAEYWVRVRTPKTLVALRPEQPGQPEQTVLLDAIGEGRARARGVLRSRVVQVPEVRQYWTNGIEWLRRPGQIEDYTRWPGRYIPIVWCLGKVLYVEDQGRQTRVILSMTRLARDPYMLYCYYRTTEAEIVGIAPKVPYFAYKGQLDPDQFAALVKSNVEPVAVVLVEPTTEAMPGQVLPHPQRTAFEPPIQALEFGAEAARRAIQAAMGVSPLPTQALRRNEKSGRALEQIELSSQKGSFHFADHCHDMIEATGVQIEDLLDKVYDTARDVAVRERDDTTKMVRINDPSHPESISTVGRYVATVSAGPSYDSEREKASDFADTLANIPPVFERIADLVIKLKNLGPIGDQIAERLTPPEYRQAQEGQADPARIAQDYAQAKAQLAQLEQLATQMKQALDTEQAKQAAVIRKAEIDRETAREKAALDQQTAIELQRMKDATAIRVAEIAAGAKLDAGATSAETEAAALAVEVEEGERDRDHDIEMAVLEHEQALESSAVANEAAREADTRSTARALAVAAARPGPSAGAPTER